MSKKIGLFTSVYFNNIGNAFIDLGANATLEAAIPEGYQLIKISQYQDFVATMGKGMSLRESKILRTGWKYLMKYKSNSLHDKFYSALSNKNVLSVLDYIHLDLLVIPGCVLTVPFFKIYGQRLKELKSEGVKFLFLGASGNYYSDYEKEYVTQFIKELDPIALMFRDPIAYNAYKDLVKDTYNGIDNAFFVNRVNIPKGIAKKDYTVLNFDNVKNQHYYDKLSPKFEHCIRTDNKPFPLNYVYSKLKKNYFISDTPMDYLILLANSKEVHSDRVHSCIPTLSLGGKCQIYSDSKRLSLFENVGLHKITSELTKIDNLEEYQNKQISYLNNILSNL